MVKVTVPVGVPVPELGHHGGGERHRLAEARPTGDPSMNVAIGLTVWVKDRARGEVVVAAIGRPDGVLADRQRRDRRQTGLIDVTEHFQGDGI